MIVTEKREQRYIGLEMQRNRERGGEIQETDTPFRGTRTTAGVFFVMVCHNVTV